VARITKLATFGAFAELEPGIEGLIHISELTDERIQHPKSVVREGDVVTVKILRIEPERRRLGLSLKQAQAENEAADTSRMPMVYGGTDDDSGESWMGGARVIRSESSYTPSEPSAGDDPEEDVDAATA
jgi:predicted RNA-binding protein with RPS1 domain